MIGTKVAHYEITSHLGSGGMGDVYQASDPKLGRDVAIKFLPESFAHDTERVARFDREARVLASLNHPNIAAIYGMEQAASRKCLVMELVGGETLAERLRRGPLPIEEALGIAKQICEALEAAHDKGIIHRDLKPANIKVTPDGKVKVLDFGLAKAIEGEPANAQMSNSPTLSMAATNAGLILGTASYMSPEQAKGRAVDRRTDVFAFGCVLFEMITGRRAFDGEDVTEILGAVVRLEPDWNQLPAATPQAVRKLLRHCLEKGIRNRRTTATDVRIDLEDALNEPAIVTTLGPTPARNARLGWITSVTFLITAAVLSIPYFRPKSAAPVMRFQISPPAGTTFSLPAPGIHMEVSPDGKHLAYFAGSEGRLPQLWVRSFDTVDARSFSGTEGTGVGQSPFWSADSRFVAFSANGQLKKVEIAGGPVQTLCNIPGGTNGNGAWSPAGVIVFGSTVSNGLYQVQAEGGNPVQLTTLDVSRGETAHLAPQFLPDGRHFLYVVHASKPEISGIYASSLDSKDAIRILYSSTKAQFAPPGELLFARNGTLFAQPFDPVKLRTQGDPVRIAENVPVTDSNGRAGFSVAESGMLVLGDGQLSGEVDLNWYDRKGNLIMRVGSANYRGIELSPRDAKRLAVHHHDDSSGGGDIWITELDRGNKDTRFTYDDPSDSSSPVWSPDGSEIAFTAIRNGQWGLYKKPSNLGGSEELLWESPAPKGPMSWSPDGKSIVFVNYDPNAQADLWILPLSGDRTPTPYLQAPGFQSHPQISPDGHWIAYRSGSKGIISGGEVYVQSYPTPGSIQQVSTGGGSIPRWRADGKEFFYINANTEIWSVTVDTNGSGLMFGTPNRLFNTRMNTNSHPNTNYFNYAVSIDGQRFLIPRTPSTTNTADLSPPLRVILNWTSLLRKD